MTVDR